MQTQFTTAFAEASAEFTERRSRFIGHIMPVQTESEALAFIETIKKQHWDATHNVYAYLVREENIRRYSDDGEPKGTAGVPVLDVLQKEGLCDVCVVVTRYFGGILLGGGGLVRAYSHAASLAVQKAGKLLLTLCTVLEVSCDYSFYQRLQQILPRFDARTTESDFGEQVRLVLRLPKENGAAFLCQVQEASAGGVSPAMLREEYAQVQ